MEAAHKPSLNEVAKNGICGLMDIISPGVPPGSDTASLALLGYDALKVYSGRGALEAVGSGMEVLSGDVAFRCNFASVNNDFVVVDRRAGRIANEDATRLYESLQKTKLENPLAKVFFRNTIQHRVVLVIHGSKLSKAVSDSDPGKIGEKVLEIKPLDESSEAKLTSEILNQLTTEFHEVLESHPVNKDRTERKLPPANIILCRGAGTVPSISPLSEIYGINAACMAASPIIRGV